MPLYKFPLVDTYLTGSPGVTGALAAAGLIPAKLDIQSAPLRVDASGRQTEGMVLDIRTVNGQGDTPTSPGEAATITVKYAWSFHDYLVDEAPYALAAVATSITCTLPNINASDITGESRYSSGLLEQQGRYLYVWIDKSAFAINGVVSLSVYLRGL
jgi:hypothetical protein